MSISSALNGGARSLVGGIRSVVPGYLPPAPQGGGQVLGTSTDEYQPPSGGGGGYVAPSGGGGGSIAPAAPAIDYAAIAAYDQGIGQANSGLERLTTQRDVGSQNIDFAHDSALNQLLSQRAENERNYNETKVSTTKDNLKAKSNIDFRTGQRANALQKLLGSRGAGSSTAARVAAPWAAAKEGTDARKEVTDAFTSNMGALDKNWEDFERRVLQTRAELWQKRHDQHTNLLAQLAEKRSSLLAQLAELQANRARAAGGNPVAAAQPYLDQVNQANSQIDGLGRQFSGPMGFTQPTYATPNLSKYDYDALQAAKLGDQGDGSAYTDSINPGYLSVLLNRKKDEAAA